MSKTKVVVIGTGRIAKVHLKCLKKLQNVEVVGVCDLSPAKAEAAAERFQIPHWHTNFEELIDKVHPNIAHVTTTASSHFAITEKLLNAGISAFVEKPIASDYGEFLTLKTLAENNSLILLENHNYQFNPPVQNVLQLIHNNEFGEVKHISVTLGLDISSNSGSRTALQGGIVMEFLTHLANLTYILAGPPARVQTIWQKDGSQSLGFNEFRALIETENRTAALVFSSNVQPECFRISIFGSKMSAMLNLFESSLILERNRKLPRPLSHFTNGLAAAAGHFNGAFRSLFGKLKGNPGGYSGLRFLLKKTYDAIEKNEPLPVTLEQMDAVNKLVKELKKGLPS